MRRILCFGDSNTWGFTAGTGVRYDENQRWTGVLQRELGDAYTVIEEGLNGRTTVYEHPTLPGRKGIDYLVPCLESQKPLDLVVLMLGTNDLRWTDARGAAEGVRRIVQTLKWAVDLNESSDIYTTRKPPILLISPIHAHELLNDFEPGDYHIGYPEKSRDFAKYYREIAEENGCAFLDASLYAEPCTEDGLHMTLESHPRFAKAVAEAVRELFK